jgi:putative transposase
LRPFQRPFLKFEASATSYNGGINVPRNVYSEINLHLTWHTKESVPALTDQVETQCHKFLTHQCVKTTGVFVHGVGGTQDHVHLAVSIPATLTISEWIGRLKGASSHHVNHEICNRKVLEWQDGYGVASFETKDLPWVLEYIRNQKEHHASKRIFDRLERIDQPEEARPEGHA